jgi:hypothetical protein
MIAPPRPPSPGKPEALIPEARDRQRRRRLLGAAGVAVVAGVALGAYAVAGGFDQSRTARAPVGGVPLCRSAQLSTVPLGFGMAPGDVGGLGVKNVSASSCALPGTPRVAAYADGTRLPVRQLPPNVSVPDNREPRVQVLPPGKRAGLVFRYWCRSPNWNARATLSYSFGGGLVLSQKSALPICGAPSTLRVAGPLA